MQNLVHYCQVNNCIIELTNTTTCTLNISKLSTTNVNKFTPRLYGKTVFPPLQSMSHGKFLAFDYGKAKNMEVYNQPTPPAFHLNNLNIPIKVYWGGEDWLATPPDVQQILRELPRKPHPPQNMYLPHYNHLDFVWGLDAAHTLYPDIIQFFRQHQD